MHLNAAVSVVAMSTGAVIAIAVGVVVFFGAILALTAARRTDVRGAGALSRETRKRDRDAEIDLPGERPTGREVERFATEQRSGELVPTTPQVPVVWVPPDPEVIGVSRRQFLNRAQVTLMTAGLGAFAAAGFTAFLWPTATGGFGGKVNIGKMDDITATIRSSRGFFYSATARSWVTIYPSEALPKARGVANYQPVLGIMEAGLTVLYQKCPHLGCRVPNCDSSQWFECPCHGSQYNRNGEKKGGPAPRGMDRFSATVSGSGDVTIDTGTVFPGPPIGTNTTGQEAEGPHCIGGGEHH